MNTFVIDSKESYDRFIKHLNLWYGLINTPYLFSINYKGFIGHFVIFSSSFQITYQCEKCPDDLLSNNYKHRKFTADNGFTLHSKNSPVILDKNNICLSGSFEYFSSLPSVWNHRLTKEEVMLFVDQLMVALQQMAHAPQNIQICK